MRKLLLIILSLIFSATTPAGTLFIYAKKVGHDQDIYFTHVHVADYGWNSAGTFIIRFQDGHQVTLGKASHWERFTTYYVEDDDQLLKY